MQQFIIIKEFFLGNWWGTHTSESQTNSNKPVGSGLVLAAVFVLVTGTISDTKTQKVLLIFCAEGMLSLPCWELHLGALCNLHWVPSLQCHRKLRIFWVKGNLAVFF